MRKLAFLVVVLVFLSQNIFAQDTVFPTTKMIDVVHKPRADIRKGGAGFYGAVAACYNLGGAFLTTSQNFHALGASTTFSFSNISCSPGGGAGVGGEFMTEEYWRWYGVFSIGITYYSYTVNGTETDYSTYYFNPPVYNISQYQVNNLSAYTFFDVSFKNYLRFIESHKQRLGLGFGLTTNVTANSNTLESIPSDFDVPALTVFLSGSLRYDISVGPSEIISIEPYYSYELSGSSSNPRLASAGLKVSLLFN